MSSKIKSVDIKSARVILYKYPVKFRSMERYKSVLAAMEEYADQFKKVSVDKTAIKSIPVEYKNPLADEVLRKEIDDCNFTDEDFKEVPVVEEEVYRWVKASERLPKSKGKYITKDKDTEVREFYYSPTSPTLWHYLDLNGKSPTENVVGSKNHISEWLEEYIVTVQEDKILKAIAWCDKQIDSINPGSENGILISIAYEHTKGYLQSL